MSCSKLSATDSRDRSPRTLRATAQRPPEHLSGGDAPQPGAYARVVGDLADYTAVNELGDGEYRALLSSDWAIWGPNGGFVAAIAVRAAGAHTRFARPASIAGHFLSVAEFGPVDIRVARFEQRDGWSPCAS